MSPLAFLVYHPRSGSTMLGNLLHAYQDIYVSYELDFEDGIIRGKKFNKDQWETLKKRPKSEAWKMPWQHLGEQQYDNFAQCLNDIGSYYSPSGVFLYKNGKYRFYLKKLIETFPQSKIIFLTRDPRSVYLSQSRSKSSVTDQAMIDNDPILFAKQFLFTEEVVKQADKTGSILRVKFEDLIEAPEENIDLILAFLQVSNQKENKDYASGISETQKHLHSNVDKGMLRSRLYPWQDTDRVEEVAIIEKICGDYLVANNYPLNKSSHSYPLSYDLKYFLGGGLLKWFWYKTKAKYSLNRDHLKLK